MLTEVDTEVLPLRHESPLVEKVKVAVVSILTLSTVLSSLSPKQRLRKATFEKYQSLVHEWYFLSRCVFSVKARYPFACPLLLFHMCLSRKMSKCFGIFSLSPHSCLFSLYGTLHTLYLGEIKKQGCADRNSTLRSWEELPSFASGQPREPSACFFCFHPHSSDWLQFPNAFQLCKNSTHSTTIKRGTLKLFKLPSNCRYLKSQSRYLSQSKLHVQP